MKHVTVSFDFMTLRMSQLEWLPQMLPALQRLFPSDEDDAAMVGAGGKE